MQIHFSEHKKKSNNFSFVTLFAVWTGLEPATPCVTGRYSNQLNYHTIADCDAKVLLFFIFTISKYDFFKTFLIDIDY